MVMFESFEHMIEWMKKKGRSAELRSTLSALEDAVERETNDLVELSIKRGEHSRRTEKLVQECKQDAQVHIYEEVEGFLRSGEKPPPLGPYDVLLYRRRPTVWAIATRIYEVASNESSSS